MNTEIIYEYCDVIAHGTIFGVEYIWYFEQDDETFGTLETCDTNGVHEIYSCNNKEEFDLIISMI